MADEPDTTTAQSKGLVDVKTSDFRETYANNVRFESSAWDLRVLLGTLDLAESEVRLHSAVNMPWLQAKLVAYFLHINVAFHEAENGPIKIPERVMPLSPEAFITEDELKLRPELQPVYDRLMAHWKTL